MDHLSLIISDQTNVVHIHLCKPFVFNPCEAPSSMTIDHAFRANELPPNVPWSNKHTYQFTEYYHQELKYIYDTSNDAQKTVQTILENERIYPMHPGSLKPSLIWYFTAFREESLPPHRFPCTKDIAHVEHIARTIYTISNRLSFHVDYFEKSQHYQLYFRYQHSPNVDIQKHNQDLHRALQSIRYKL